MVQAYLEDSSVSEDGALTRFGDFIGGVGRKLFTGLLVASPIIALVGGLTALPFIGGTAAVAAIAGTGVAAGGLGLAGIALAAVGTLAGMAAIGGGLRGLDSFKNHQPRKAIKETLKGVAQGGAMVAAATLLGPFALLGVAALEGASLLFTRKSLLTHIGEVAGAALDATIGDDKPKTASVTQMAQARAQSMGLSQSVGVAPSQTIANTVNYGGLPASGGRAYSSVPAAVGYDVPMTQAMQQPPSTYWQDQVGGRATQQQQANVKLDASAGKQWQDRMAMANTAVEQGLVS